MVPAYLADRSVRPPLFTTNHRPEFGEGRFGGFPEMHHVDVFVGTFGVQPDAPEWLYRIGKERVAQITKHMLFAGHFVESPAKSGQSAQYRRLVGSRLVLVC